jgi:RNA recognition motif-containing protein
VGVWKGESSKANRQGYVHRLDKVATSYYFTNLPDNVKAVDLWPRFAKFGRVGEVFIPAKVDKQGKRFGFVKFREVQDDKDLLRRISNIWIDSFKLRVNLSKFSRRTDANHKEEGKRREEPKDSSDVKYGGGHTQAGKSFKSALIEKEEVRGKKKTWCGYKHTG